MMKNGVYFIVIAHFVGELFKILIYANKTICDVILWTQSDVKSPNIQYLSQLFLSNSD